MLICPVYSSEVTKKETWGLKTFCCFQMNPYTGLDEEAREGTKGGGSLDSQTSSTILDYWLFFAVTSVSLSHAHTQTLALFFSLLSLPPSFCLCSATFSTRWSAFGFFHLWQITVTLLYNNFLPFLALLLKTAKAELAASTFYPRPWTAGPHWGQKKRKGRCKMYLLLRNYFGCIAAYVLLRINDGHEGTTRQWKQKGGG